MGHTPEKEHGWRGGQVPEQRMPRRRDEQSPQDEDVNDPARSEPRKARSPRT